MEEKKFDAIFTVHTNNWNTLGLVQKVMNEGEKVKAPIRIEIKSGSYESSIQIISNLAAIADFMLALVIYFESKRSQDKPIEVVKISRDAAYAAAWGHLKNSAKVKNAKLFKESQDNFGIFQFIFIDSSNMKHIYHIGPSLKLTYKRTL